MDFRRRALPWWLLAVGVLGAVACTVSPRDDPMTAVLYLGTAALATGMALAGALQTDRPRRRIWVALAAGQVLYLVGDALWEYYEYVLHVDPYPSLADAAYLLRYAAVALALSWLVRGRQVGRDRAAFLDAAILTTAFALPAAMFVIIPALSTQASLVSRLVAAAYPAGDLLVLAVLLRLVQTPAARNLAFSSLSLGLVLLLGVDVFYLVIVSLGHQLPQWTNFAYLLTYLLIGFAAMHPSSAQLSEPTAEPVARPLAAKIAAMAGASLVAPALLAWETSIESPRHELAIAIGGGLCSVLVLLRFVDLLRHSESQALQLTVLARTDSLTGVPNRRSWDVQLARATDNASAAGPALTVAMIDLDDFKLYNDKHGHLAGDLALKETAAGWASILEGHGYLARYGGEEFAVLISSASREECDSLLHRIHATVARGQTCSVGVSRWQPGEPAAHAVLRADESLYEAKRAGRDRVVWHVVDRPEAPQAPDPAAQPRALEPFVGA